MNEKVKEIINKYKPEVDKAMKYARESTFIDLMTPEETFEIFKSVLDEFESESDNKIDNKLDKVAEPDNQIIELKECDVKFDYNTATTQRMSMLINNLTCILYQSIRYNTVTNELAIAFQTFNETKYTSLYDQIRHILYEDGSDIQHRIFVILKTPQGTIKHKVRILEANFHIDNGVHFIYMKFDKCQ